MSSSQLGDVTAQAERRSPLEVNQSTGHSDIRLLLIEPPGNDQAEEKISCRVEHYDISEASWSEEWKHSVTSLDRPVRPSDRLHWRQAHEPAVPRYVWGDYYALSYTWGNLDEQATIVLNGFDFKVTKNLENALRNLRDCNALPEQHFLWVDALCINQEDLLERASEVQRMQAIYSSSIETMVYLGSGDPTTEAGIEFINAAGCSWDDPVVLHQAMDRYFETTNVNIWDQILGLIELPYWWRQWVIQELVSGSDEKPLYYSRTFTLSKWIWQVFNQFERRNRYKLAHCAAFWDALEKHPEHYRKPGEVKTFGEFGGPIGRRKFAFASDGEVTMSTYQILTMVRKGHATNPRDYVYGLLGLLDPSLAARIKVDYTISVEAVYEAFARTIIKTEESLEILGQCDIFGTPSWVPRMDVNSPWYRHIHSEEEEPYNSSGGRNAVCRFDKQPDMTADSAPGLLYTRAILLDQLDGLSTANLETDFRDENRIYKGGYADRLVETSGNSNAYGSEDALKEAMWRVVGGNRDVRGAIPAPNTYSLLLSSEALEDQYEFFGAGATSSPWADWVGKNSKLKIAGKTLVEYFTPAGLATMNEDKLSEHINHISSAIHRFEQACWSRRIAVTIKGYLCLVPWYAEKNDYIAVMPGCSFPVLLRSTEDAGFSDEKVYKVVSPCYVHGVMEGEIWADLDRGKVELEDVTLA